MRQKPLVVWSAVGDEHMDGRRSTGCYQPTVAEMTTYRLFEKAVRALSSPDACEIGVRCVNGVLLHRGTMTEKDPDIGKLPWFEFDAVLSAVWYPADRQCDTSAKRRQGIRIFPHYRDRGIGVRTDFDARELHVYGVCGVVADNRPNFDKDDPSFTERHAFPSEGEAIRALRQLLHDARFAASAGARDAQVSGVT